MKIKPEMITSILAIASFVCTFIIVLFTESEMVEAIAGGLVLGGMIGSVFGVISLIINKGKSKLVTIFSVVPMIPVVLWFILFVVSR